MPKSIPSWVFIVAFFPAAAFAQAEGDSVFGMCAEQATTEVCQCAADDLRAEIGDDDYALYEAIGADYLTRMKSGDPRSDAWTAAVEAASSGSGMSSTEMLTRTNKFGSAHRTAMIQCMG